MADKPKPKTELIVSLVGDHIFMEASTNDAIEWIEQEAKQFGYLDFFENSNKYMLHVSELYNPLEVAQYLESYLKPDDQD